MANELTIPEANTTLINQGAPSGGVISADWYRLMGAHVKATNQATRDITATQGDVTTLQGDVTGNSEDITTLQGQVTTLQQLPAFAHAEYTTNTSLTTAIPADDTIPQITEGTQVLSLSISAKRATSLIYVRFTGFGGVATAGPLIVALF